jgi:hypothetical protein
MEKVKKYLAAIAAVLGIVSGYGLAEAGVVEKLQKAVSASQAAVDVLAPAAPAPEAAPAE